ncbi:efflux transporter outer membrane subunit [Zwartia sp.]|uniref:efflux transporter outer membrane subunit n=1 Tax=Zwartia sp. TaxID=2978004 RepID=UPI00271C89F9|nr:efflux transporter outer membrane subunit [Zwartia sp.]MDO9023160.1 efflux transporter outer membrane subunit [Zwartia sp.]
MTRLRLGRVGICVGLLSSLTLVGCAPFPEMRAPAAETRADALETKTSFLAPSGDWPTDLWWTGYGDHQLDQLVKEALEYSPTLNVAQARVRRAQAMTQVAGAPLQPEINLNATAGSQRLSYNYLTPPGNVVRGWNEFGQAALNMNWELDFWGKYRAGLAAATSELAARQAEEAQARLILATAVASGYAELARLFALKDAAERAADVRAKTHSLFAERHLHGLETRASVLEAQAKESQARTEVLFLDEQIALQRNSLASLVGAGPDRGLSIERPNALLQKKFTLPTQLSANLIGRRPDIVAARLRAQSRASLVERKAADFYPNINLVAMLGVQSLGLDVLGQSGSVYGNIGPAISLPIFTGGRLQGELRGARADFDEAVASYNETLIHAFQNVSDVATRYRALTAQQQEAERGLRAASQANQLALGRYRGGLSSYLDVLISEDIMLTSLRLVADLRARNFMLDVALVRALGGGYLSSQTAPIHLSTK